MPEVSFLLAIVTMVVSSFSVVCHPDGSRIDLGVEGQLHIISVLRVIVVINVRWDVVLFGFNFHGRLHLCGVDGDVGTIVVLPVVACLVSMTIIRPYIDYCRNQCTAGCSPLRLQFPWPTPLVRHGW